jgi:hypothetical protein
MGKANSNFVFNSISTSIKVEVNNVNLDVNLDERNVKIGKGGGGA